MRRRYETGQSRSEDLEILEILESFWGKDRYKLVPTGVNCRFDAWVCERREKMLGNTLSRSALALVELKKRAHPYGRYPSVIISLSKWRYLRWIQTLAMKPQDASDLREDRHRPIDIVLAIKWSDSLGFYRFDELHEIEGHLRIEEEGGRTKATRDKWDIESVVHVPIELFDLVA